MRTIGNEVNDGRLRRPAGHRIDLGSVDASLVAAVSAALLQASAVSARL